METKDWLLFIGPLLGVIVAGVIGIVIEAIKYSRDRDKRDRRALEDLHLRIEKYSALGDVVNVYDFDSVEKMNLQLREGLANLRSLQKIYAPELGEAFVAIMNAAAAVYASASHENLRPRVNNIQMACSNFNQKLEGKIRLL
jgi:hypothetical protein